MYHMSPLLAGGASAMTALAGNKRASANSGYATKKRLHFNKITVTHDVNTRFDRAQAAANAVMHTKELLMKILINMDAASLLAMRATNSIIKHTVDNEEVFQPTIFLKSIHHTYIVELLCNPKTAAILRYDTRDVAHYDLLQMFPQPKLKLATPNPFVFTRQNSEIRDIEERFRTVETLRFTMRPHQQALLTSLNAQQSMVYRMHVTQPPTNAVEIYFAFNRAKPTRANPDGNGEGRQFFVRCHGGVRVGMLLQALKMYVYRQEKREVSVEDFWLKLAKCATWMKGTVFATEK